MYALPRILDDTYEQIVLRIDDIYRPSVFKILQWLAFSARPMTIKEAAEIVAIDLSGDGLYNINLKLLDPNDVMLLCSNLVRGGNFRQQNERQSCLYIIGVV